MCAVVVIICEFIGLIPINEIRALRRSPVAEIKETGICALQVID